MVLLEQLSVIMVHLRGFCRPFVSKRLVCCCCGSSSLFLVKPGSMDYPTYISDLAVRHFYFWTTWEAPGWQAICGWYRQDANRHLLAVDTRHRFLVPRGASLGAMLTQTLKCQWWQRDELMYSICCPCAVYEYIEVRMKFWSSEFLATVLELLLHFPIFHIYAHVY